MLVADEFVALALVGRIVGPRRWRTLGRLGPARTDAGCVENRELGYRNDVCDGIYWSGRVHWIFHAAAVSRKES